MSTGNLKSNKFEERYQKTVVKELKGKFGYKNIMSVPKLEKIVVNVGVGSIASGDKKRLESIYNDLILITGQKPVYVKSTRAIAGFNVKIGSVVGIRATLRGEKMRQFFNRLAMMSLPRVRDFQGIRYQSIDKNGNLNVGVREHIIFPEIKPEESIVNFGLQITFKNNAKSQEEAFELLTQLGLPIISKK